MTEEIGIIADILGIIAAVIAIWTLCNTYKILKENRAEKERLNQKVKIILKDYDSNNSIQLQGKISKSEILRYEVLGRIGMLPMKVPKTRYEIRYIHSNEFFDQLNDVKKSHDKDKIIIPCSKEELDQFDVK